MKNVKNVIGVDEVGRGCLAGPVLACACFLPSGFPVEILCDSKKLSKKRRNEVAVKIREFPGVVFVVARVSVGVIDKINIRKATHRAMRVAIGKIREKCPENSEIFIDGVDDLGVGTAVVGGDAKIAAISAASILAKCEKDKSDVRLAKKHSNFDFESHAGYGTVGHRAEIEKNGRTVDHRVSFRFKK